MTNLHQIPATHSNEWYTPWEYVNAARQTMGGIDLDPASCAYANNVVQAREFFDMKDDGLMLNWEGRVFCNPPYGMRDGKSNQARWSTKFLTEYGEGRIEQGVLLLNAMIAQSWFKPLWDFPLCFTYKRIRFYNKVGIMTQPTNGNVFVYVGGNVTRFRQAFEPFGKVIA